MIKYKVIDQEGYSRKGEPGETFWLDGVQKIAKGEGNVLCTDNVIHFYDHPALAVLFNSIQAEIENPRMIEIKIDEEVAHDGLKGGCKKAKFTKEIAVPQITCEQKVEFAIRISLKLYREKSYVAWAQDWLTKKDRSAESAEKASKDAGDVAMAASAAARAVSATARTESPAEKTAAMAESTARAAVMAASAAERAASAAGNAAGSDEWITANVESAECVAWTAEWVTTNIESAAKANNLRLLFVETIEDILKN